MRLLSLPLLVPPLLIALYSNAHAEDTMQQICHNGVCYDIGGPGDECCPFSIEQLKSNAQHLENLTENLANSKVSHSITNKTSTAL
jgi:hypothetical protein